MSEYLSVGVMDCVRAGHKLTISGSGKTPVKKNLICESCSLLNPGKTAYCAYGDDTKGFGAWPTRRKATKGDDNEYTETSS